jgi:hypothetical protein
MSPVGGEGGAAQMIDLGCACSSSIVPNHKCGRQHGVLVDQSRGAEHVEALLARRAAGPGSATGGDDRGSDVANA